MDKYPVTPYLDNRDSFSRWTHFIHNKYNELLGKDELPLHAGIDKYLDEYKPKPMLLTETFRIKTYMVHLILILVCLIVIYMFSDRL